MPTIFDQSAIQLGLSSNISDFAIANDFTLGASFTLQGANLFLTDLVGNDNGTLDNFSGTLGWAIYADNGSGLPGTLLFSGQDAVPVVTDTGQNNFGSDIMQAEISFGTTIQLDAGTYWLALHEGNWGSAFDGSAIHWMASTASFGAAESAIDPDETNPVTWSDSSAENAFSIEGVATLVVTTSADVVNAGDGVLSLREAVTLANANADASFITFDASLSGSAIILNGTQLSLTQDVTIDGDTNGDNKADITISGGDAVRIFSITGSGTDAALLSLTLTNGYMSGNGGAVFASSISSLEIGDTTIQNSFATGSGGGLYARDVLSVTVTTSLFNANQAGSFGGGIYVRDANASLTNTTLQSNVAGSFGGGISANSSDVVLLNSTVTGNQAHSDGNSTNFGGGIDDFASVFTITNSVIAENTSGIGLTANDVYGPLETATNSVFGTDVTIVNATNVQESVGNIGLGVLADNGGTVMTRNIVDISSPLFNTGSNAAASGLTQDANGNDRVGDGTVDIGASEFSGPLVVTTAADIVDANDGFLSLREAVALANAGADADTITFASNLAGSTITLNATLGELSLTQDVTIDGDVNGDNKADITISGGDAVRIFNMTGADTDVDLLSLTLTDGNVGSGLGGAVYAVYIATLDIADTTISSSAAGGGGGLFASFTDVTLTNSLVSGNAAAGDGGGINLRFGTLVATNTTINGNATNTFGGGISAYGSGVTLLNSTVTGNRADADGSNTASGGGIDDFVTNTITITNSVVAGNTSGIANALNDVAGTVDTATNSAFGTDVTGVTGGVGGNLENVTSGQLLLGTLADNGGTVNTINVLGPLSVLVNAGSNAGAAGITQDANGNDRIGDGTVDIGATEFSGPIVVTTSDDVVDANDGLLSLREAVALANAGADADTILFASNLAGSTVTLNATLGELELTQDVTIDGDVNGDNKADITISGGDAVRIFSITGSTTEVDLLSLTLTDGFLSAPGSSSMSNGAAVSVRDSAHLTIINSTVRDSVTLNGFGGGISVNGTITAVNSTFANNSAETGGGVGIYNYDSGSFVNVTFYGNTATYRGGGMGTGAQVTLSVLNSTFAGNSAGTRGGGLQISAGTDATISNTVIAGNTAGVSSDFSNGSVSNGTNVINNSVFGSDVDGVINNVDGNLENAAGVWLGELLDNGGTVLTLAPLDGSILINRGKPSLLPLDIHDIDGDGNVTERLPTDATGEARVQKPVLDIGAVEYTRNETIIGTAGADVIVGGFGRDTLIGRAGADTLNGGAGKDTADYSASALGVTVSLRTGVGLGGDAQGDTFIMMDNLTGSAQADSLTGNQIINVLVGNGGDDTLIGQAGDDTLLGGAGTDRLIGGTGIDKLTGGADADTFVLGNLAVNYDIIFDFTAGVDTLEISASVFGGGLVAGAALTADQFIANPIGTARDAEDRFVLSTNTGILYFDADGSGTGERVLIAIFRDPLPALTHEDFMIV